MTNDKKLMLLAGVLALGMLAGCSSASAASAASGMAGSMPAASEVEEVSSEVRVLSGEEGVIMPIDQGSLEEMKTGSYKFAANISSVDAKKRQMTLTVYGYDAYRAEECAWLKKAVRSEEFLTASARIVLLHIPPAAGAWHGSVHLNELFVPVLNEAGIDLMLCGHDHRYSFHPAGEVPDRGQRQPKLRALRCRRQPDPRTDRRSPRQDGPYARISAETTISTIT